MTDGRLRDRQCRKSPRVEGSPTRFREACRILIPPRKLPRRRPTRDVSFRSANADHVLAAICGVVSSPQRATWVTHSGPLGGFFMTRLGRWWITPHGRVPSKSRWGIYLTQGVGNIMTLDNKIPFGIVWPEQGRSRWELPFCLFLSFSRSPVPPKSHPFLAYNAHTTVSWLRAGKNVLRQPITAT
jgi:hypothetical protein